MNARPEQFLVDASVMAERQAAAVAAALNMIADQLRLTAERTQHEPLVRRRISDVVGSLIELADALAGDADLEPDNDDEPSLGWGANLISDLSSGDDRECDAGDEPEFDTDGEQTARESHGAGFPADASHDDDEDGHDAEDVNEDGSVEGL